MSKQRILKQIEQLEAGTDHSEYVNTNQLADPVAWAVFAAARAQRDGDTEADIFRIGIGALREITDGAEETPCCDEAARLFENRRRCSHA